MALKCHLQPVSGMGAYLKLRKQCYKCGHCGCTFTLKTPVVNPHCFISNDVKKRIVLIAHETRTEKSIAKQLGVSNMTVNRNIFEMYEFNSQDDHYLPESLCFDEFKSVKSSIICYPLYLHFKNRVMMIHGKGRIKNVA